MHVYFRLHKTLTSTLTCEMAHCAKSIYINKRQKTAFVVSYSKRLPLTPDEQTRNFSILDRVLSVIKLFKTNENKMRFSIWQFRTCKSTDTIFYFWQKTIHPGLSHSSPKLMSLWIRVLVWLWLQKTQTTTPWYSLFSAFYLVQLFYGTIPTLWQSRGTGLTNRYSFSEFCIVLFEMHLGAQLFFWAFDKSCHLLVIHTCN